MTAQVPGKPKAGARKAPAGRASARRPSNKKTTAAGAKRHAPLRVSPARPRLRGVDRLRPFEMELSPGWSLVGKIAQGRIRAHLEHTRPASRAA